ncbi:MAG: ABC transporter ATP-binding protein [Pseudomonadota bacterium]
MSNLLEIRDLNVDFKTPRGRVHALRNVSIDVREKRILGIVGESGSGKSTVIWAATQLLANNASVESGEILFEGKNVFDLDEAALLGYRGQQVSLVFQDPMTSQIPVLSYARQMSDIQYRQKHRSTSDKLQRAVEMMRRVGIPDPEARIQQFPHHFSGGMRQRASIAMALMMDPPLLIADEPTTALDVTMEAQIIHLMRELKEEFESTVIVVSHNLGLIAELCDDVVVMYAGEVVEQGDVRQIFYRPQHPYTQALLECDPARVLERSKTLPTIAGDVPDLHKPPKSCVFASRCPKAFEACYRDKPTYREAEAGQMVRCHLPNQDVATQSRVEEASPNGKVAHGPGEAISAIRSDEPILRISDLNVRFRIMGALQARLKGIADPFVDAVMGVSLDLRPGETLGLVGESGSGKTTLGRTVLGLVPAHSGSVTFEGRELIGLKGSEFLPLRQDMAMMFQDPVGSLSPRQTIRSLITEPFEFHRAGQEDLQARAEHLINMVSLPRNFLNRYPHELSGGQARRVGVARALALQPKLIIADEPTAGLDVSVQGEILNLMAELQRHHGLSYLIITHNLPVVRHISDRLAIMYLGRIIEQGDCNDIFERPAHPYTEALVNGVPRPDPDQRRNLVSIEGEVPSLTNRPTGCEFHTRCRYATERCRTDVPRAQSLPDGRQVLCHFPLTQ